MIRHLLTAVLLSPFFFQNLFSQAISFSKTFGATGYDDARSIVATADGLVFTGLCQSGSDPAGDLYLTKINAAGAVVWSRTFGREKEDGGNHLLATADGGFLVTGHTALSYGEACDGYLLRTDALGRELWRSFLGATLDDVSDCALELPDGSFWVAGKTQLPDDRSFRPFLARVGGDGVFLSQKTLDPGYPCVPHQLAISADGSLLLAGHAYQTDRKAEDVFLMKCDPDGTPRWSRRLERPGNERAFALLLRPDGSCFVAGGVADDRDLPLKMLALRFDAAGDLLAEAEFTGVLGAAGTLRCAAFLSDGNLVFGGETGPTPDDPMQPCLLLCDENLRVRQHRILERTGVDCRTRCLTLSRDGAVVAGGRARSAEGETDVFFEKINFPEMDAANNGEGPEAVAVLVFPNPFREEFFVRAGAVEGEKRIRLFDAQGRVVRSLRLPGNEFFIRRDGLPGGLFFLEILDEQGRQLARERVLAE